MFLYEPDVLVEMLEKLHHELSDEPHEGDDDEGDTGLGDFGDLLIPRLVDRGKVYAHQLDGYWRDLGQPHHYLNAHLELLDQDAGLFSSDWPIRTQQPQREAARVLEGARIDDSLLSSGCVVAGTVTRSVLGPGVLVEAGSGGPREHRVQRHRGPERRQGDPVHRRRRLRALRRGARG